MQDSISATVTELVKAFSYFRDTKPEVAHISGLRTLRDSVFRKIPESFERTKESIAIGIISPVIVSASNLIIDGEVRVDACGYMNIREHPIIKMDYSVSDEMLVAIRIALNPHKEPAKWATKFAGYGRVTSPGMIREDAAKDALQKRSRSYKRQMEFVAGYEASIVAAAEQAVGSIRTIDAIARCCEKEPVNLAKARENIKSAIRLMCQPLQQ